MPKIINDITQEYLADYNKASELCKKHHLIAPAKNLLHMTVENANNELVLDYITPCRSPVRNAYNLLVGNMYGIASAASGTTFGAGSLAIKPLTGTVASSADRTPVFYYASIYGRVGAVTGFASDVTWGILVGSGSSAETFEDYALTALITTGTGAGQLAYQASSAPTFAYAAETKKFTVTHTRIFNNNGAAAVTVAEVALVANLYVHNIGLPTMLYRDVLTTPVEIPAGYKYTLSMIFETTFPA